MHLTRKVSFHVVGGPAFKNLYHVGAIIRKFIIRACVGPRAPIVDNDGSFIIDEAIYTKGGNFVLGAHKLGSRASYDPISCGSCTCQRAIRCPRGNRNHWLGTRIHLRVGGEFIRPKDDGSWVRRGTASCVQVI